MGRIAHRIVSMLLVLVAPMCGCGGATSPAVDVAARQTAEPPGGSSTSAVAPLTTRDPSRVEVSRSASRTANIDAIRQHAAAFIPCPSDQVDVEQLKTYGDQTFLADGCGKRVHYGECQPKNRAASYCFIVTSIFSQTPSGTP